MKSLEIEYHAANFYGSLLIQALASLLDLLVVSFIGIS